MVAMIQLAMFLKRSLVEHCRCGCLCRCVNETNCSYYCGYCYCYCWWWCWTTGSFGATDQRMPTTRVQKPLDLTLCETVDRRAGRCAHRPNERRRTQLSSQCPNARPRHLRNVAANETTLSIDYLAAQSSITVSVAVTRYNIRRSRRISFASDKDSRSTPVVEQYADTRSAQFEHKCIGLKQSNSELGQALALHRAVLHANQPDATRISAGQAPHVAVCGQRSERLRRRASLARSRHLRRARSQRHKNLINKNTQS